MTREEFFALSVRDRVLYLLVVIGRAVGVGIMGFVLAITLALWVCLAGWLVGRFADYLWGRLLIGALLIYLLFFRRCECTGGKGEQADPRPDRGA